MAAEVAATRVKSLERYASVATHLLNNECVFRQSPSLHRLNISASLGPQLTMRSDPFVVSDSEEDEDLKLAIQRSLQEDRALHASREKSSESCGESAKLTNIEATKRRRKVAVIDLVSDNEEERRDIRNVSHLGRMVQKRARRQSKEISRAPPHGVSMAATPTTESTTKASSMLGMDRVQMEKERLERAAKRKKLAASPQPNKQGVSQRSDSTTWSPEYQAPSSTTLPTKRGVMKMHTVDKDSFTANSSSFKAPMSHSPRLQYPNGVVKKTFLTGETRQSDDITIDEVLQKETLTTTVLSAFQWHYEWIMNKLPLNKPQFDMVLVMQGKHVGERAHMEAIFSSLPKTRLVFPNMEGQVGYMHSKLMLLFHRKDEEQWLRVAVPTANLTEYDWGGQGAVMENMVFLIDLPRLPSSSPQQTLFAKELHHFCTEQGMPDDVLDELSMYNYEKTKSMAFVHSIGGSHSGEQWKRTGYCGLGTAIKKLGYACGQGLEVDFVTSSLGAANENFISNIYRAAMGDNSLRELQRKSSKPTKKITAAPNRKVKEAATSIESTHDDPDSEYDDETNWDRIQSHFRIYFPSKDTVVNSKNGIISGGTICFQRDWWNAATFPKPMVRDCQSTRQGLLMHNKLLFARPPKRLDTPTGKVDAWAYVGSANLSESAWGKLVMDRTSKRPKLNCRNWECGVIVPVSAKSHGQSLADKIETEGGKRSVALGMDVFDGVIPVPMKVSAEPMGNKDPWFFKELSSYK